MEQYKCLNKSLISAVIISIILLVTTSIGLNANPILAADGSAPETEWEKTFGGSSSDGGYSVQQTSDGGYIIAGQTESYGAGDYDGWLIKTDSSGNETWSKTFGGSGPDGGISVQQISDGGYIIAGFTSSYGAGDNDVWLIKVTA